MSYGVRHLERRRAPVIPLHSPVSSALGYWACVKSQGFAPSAAASADWPWSSASSGPGWTSCSEPGGSPWSERASQGWTWADAASAAGAPWSWTSPCPGWPYWTGRRSHLRTRGQNRSGWTVYWESPYCDDPVNTRLVQSYFLWWPN